MMFYRLLILLLISSPALALDGRVVAVADGDTITILDAGNNLTKVRLHGVDAPEKSQPFGTASKHHLSIMIFGKHVSVTDKGLDKYRRTLGVVYLDGRDINAQMVADGYAWAYVKYSWDYEAAEGDARQAQCGLWVGADPVPPWEWRRSSRKR